MVGGGASGIGFLEDVFFFFLFFEMDVDKSFLVTFLLLALILVMVLPSSGLLDMFIQTLYRVSYVSLFGLKGISLPTNFILVHLQVLFLKVQFRKACMYYVRLRLYFKILR